MAAPAKYAFALIVHRTALSTKSVLSQTVIQDALEAAHLAKGGGGHAVDDGQGVEVLEDAVPYLGALLLAEGADVRQWRAHHTRRLLRSLLQQPAQPRPSRVGFEFCPSPEVRNRTRILLYLTTTTPTL